MPAIDEQPPSTPDSVEQLKQKTVSGALSYMLMSLTLNGINLTAAALLSAYLSVSDFGIFGIVSAIIGLLTFFSDIGLASALIQKKEEPTLIEYRTVFTIQQILSWAIFGITFLIYLSGIYDTQLGGAGGLVLIALGLSFPLASLKTIPSIMLERKLLFSKLAIPQIVEQVVYNSIVIYCALHGYGVISFAYGVIARSIAGIVTLMLLKRWSIGLALDVQAVKDMMNTGAKFQLNDVLARVKDQLFYVLLGKYLSPTEFGYVSFAKSWSMMPYQLTVQNVISITFPTYARLQHDKALLKRAIEKTLYFISLLIFPMLVGMSVMIFPLTELVTKYQKWQPALLTFVFFTLSIGWGAISTPLTNTLSAIGKINQTLKLMVMWTVLTWVVTPICMYFFGFNGVAFAAFLISFSSVLPIYYVRQSVQIEVWEEVWRQLLAAGVMGVVGIGMIPVMGTHVLWLLGGGVAMSATYGVVLLIVGREKLVRELLSLRKKK